MEVVQGLDFDRRTLLRTGLIGAGAGASLTLLPREVIAAIAAAKPPNRVRTH